MPPTSSAPTSSSGRALVLAAFFVSGVGALVQEIAWTRLLGPFLGSTAQAQAIVLAIFMGGLAAGSTLFGRRADRSGSPLRLYAILELVIAIYALALPWLVRAAGSAFVAVASRAGEDATLVRTLLRLALASAVLLVPAILMGGTLPILARHLVKSLGETRARVGELYTINTFGAVAGAMLGGFVLLERVGVQGSLWIAAALALAAGGGAWLLSSPASASSADSDDATGSGEGAQASAGPGAASAAGATSAVGSAPLGTTALVALGASGFAAMVYEIVMIRAVGLALGSSTYAFTMMLVAFIVGIGLGSFLVSRLRIERPLVAIGWSQLAGALAFLAITPLLERLAWYAGLARCHCATPEPSLACFLGLGTSLVLALLVVPTACLGAAFPLVAQAAQRSIGSVGARVGWTYACNTLGNVSGAVVASLVLVPTLGIGGSLELGVALNLLAAALTLVGGARVKERLAALALAVVAVAIYVPARDWPNGLNLAAQHFRLRSHPPESYAAFERIYNYAPTKQFLEEDSLGTVLVAGVPPDLTLYVNGKADASSGGDLTTQLLLGHIPMLMAPKHENVLTIGFGAGFSAGAIARHPIARQDLVEISPAVLNADALFREWNGAPLQDPRTKAYLEDARSFIRTTPRLYDVIVSEPSNPWVVGVAGLFSREFFRDAASKLSPGGVLCLWFHEYEQSSEAVALVVRTLAAEFPEIWLWREYGFTDMVLVASREPLPLDFAEMERRFDAVRADMARIGIPSLAALFGHNAAGPGEMKRAAGPGPEHTDLEPHLEFLAARAVLAGTASDFGWLHDLHYRAPSTLETGTLLDRYRRWRAENGRPLTKSELQAVVTHMAASLPPGHRILKRFGDFANAASD
ncbi:MAG: fused MFS/spermidine synthase [Planctomycetes bacterium]|nr:fused MFS/spermidine synthase [Planctomycetota bacterium]